jgi:biotin transport system substrate-specific component
MKIRDMVFTALFAAIICVMAPFVIPMGPIPLSLATFAIYIAASVMNWKYGTLAVIIYIALGVVGLPVFSGFTGGLPKLVGPTGGFILGYILLALAEGFFIDKLESKKWAYSLGMVIGSVLLYTCGTIWFMIIMNVTLAKALALCVIPFLLGDIVKIILASFIAPRLRKMLKKQEILRK